ncbi:hypothetical protein GCM10009672_00590 [Nesterenkonia lutea]
MGFSAQWSAARAAPSVEKAPRSDSRYFLLRNTVDHAAVWALAAFVAGGVYLIVESIETALAEKILRSAGDAEAETVDP